MINNISLEKRRLIFEGAKALAWDKDSLVDFRKRLKLSKDTFYEVTNDYAYNVLHFDRNTFLNFKRTCKAFKEFLNNSLNDFNLAMEYFQKFADAEEKELFLARITNILDYIKNLLRNNPGDFDYLVNGYGLSLSNMNIMITTFGIHDQELVQLFFGSFKSFYDTLMDEHKRRDDIVLIARTWGLKYKEYVTLAKGYAKFILGKKVIGKSIYSDNKTNIKDGKYITALRMAEEVQDLDVLEQIFTNYNIDRADFTYYVYTKRAELSDKEKEDLLQSLRDKYDRCRKNRANRKILNIKQYYIQAFREFLELDISLEEFAERKGRSITAFKKGINYLDSEMQNRVIQHATLNKKPYVNEQMPQLKLLASYIIKGITVNNETRPFDLLDFFTISEFRDIDVRIHYFKGLTPQENTAVRKMFNTLGTFSSYINK